MKKETSVIRGDKGTARNIGAGIGAIGGFFLGGPGAAAAAAGAGVGASFGPFVEEGLDLSTGKRTDGEIRFRIKEVKDQIVELEGKIFKVLMPAIEKAKIVEAEAKKDFLECLRKAKR